MPSSSVPLSSMGLQNHDAISIGMIQFLLVIIFISAALSFLSYVYCWNDIRSGRPQIVSLRQITGVMDRERLNQWFGRPAPGYYYTLTPEQVKGILWWRAWFVRSECALDGVCLFGAWWFSHYVKHAGFVYGFIFLGGLCQIVNLAHSFWLMQKWQHQIREEVENSEE